MSKKRGNGEGTIRPLKSGRWSWSVMIGRDAHGKILYDRLIADTKKELQDKIIEYQAQRRQGRKETPTFTLFSNAWWNRHKFNVRVSTQGSSIYVLQKLQSYWEDTPIDQITASAVHDMLIYFDSEMHLSNSYITKLRGMMHQIMQTAEADDLVRHNPVRYIVFRPQSATNAKILCNKKDAFSLDEIAEIYTAPASKIRDFLLIMIATGLRSQEVLALRGTSIGQAGSCIHVKSAVNMERSKPIIGSTKNKSSIRVVPVPVTIQSIVAKYITYGDNLIWESDRKKGQPINPSTFRAQTKKFCKGAGVRCLTPHCGRHTCITQLRAHGVDSEVVKALVGHTRNDVTEGYNHIPWAVLVKAMDTLNDLFVDKKADPKRSA